MKFLNFAIRNTKEILRDPLNLIFGIGFPVILILLLSSIQAGAHVEFFKINYLTPGITIFGLSFMTLFSATLIARDRSSSFLQRLYTTPLTSVDFILGYMIPIIPISIFQCVICYVVAIILGLNFTINIFYAILFIIPISVLYISMGLLCGSIMNDKQVGGICGALLTNVSAWFSGTWFDLDLVGRIFKNFANVLPFVHAVELERAVLSGNFSNIFPHLWWVVGYAIIIFLFSVFLFLRQMKIQ